MTRESMMTRGSIIRLYKALSPEDRAIFKKWAKANFAAALIIVAAAIAIAVSASSFHAARIAQMANHSTSLPARGPGLN